MGQALMWADRAQTERELFTWRENRLWVSEDIVLGRHPAVQMKEWEEDAHLEVAWSGEESEWEPMGREFGGQGEKSEPSSMSGEWGTNSNANWLCTVVPNKLNILGCDDEGDNLLLQAKDPP